MKPTITFELPMLTPYEVARRSAPNEKEAQELCLYLEIKRAEKRLAALLKLRTNARFGKGAR